MYEIRYRHTSTDTARSIADAIRKVRRELKVNRLYRAVCPDGIYCYRDSAGKAADCDGSRADAVICTPEGKQEGKR